MKMHRTNRKIISKNTKSALTCFHYLPLNALWMSCIWIPGWELDINLLRTRVCFSAVSRIINRPAEDLDWHALLASSQVLYSDGKICQHSFNNFPSTSTSSKKFSGQYARKKNIYRLQWMYSNSMQRSYNNCQKI